MLQSCLRTLRTSCVVLLAALFSSSAYGAAFGFAWDPLYGTAFPLIGWNGYAQVEFPNSCIITSGDVTDSCGGNAKITQAWVKLYDKDVPTTLIELTFAPPDFSPIPVLRFAGGTLVGMEVALPFVGAGAPSNPPPNFAYQFLHPTNEVFFSLRFELDGFICDVGCEIPYSGPYMAHDWCGECFGTSELEDSAYFPQNFRIVRLDLPEPSTITLLCLAIATVAGVGRMKRREPSEGSVGTLRRTSR